MRTMWIVSGDFHRLSDVINRFRIYSELAKEKRAAPFYLISPLFWSGYVRSYRMYKTRILIRFASGQSIVSVFGTLFAQKTERNDGRQIDSKSRNKFTGDTSAIQWNLILNCALRKFRVFYFDQSKNFVSFLMHDAQTHTHTP